MESASPQTEREKMLAGSPYRSRDPELLALYHRAQALLASFRSTFLVGHRGET